MVRSRLREKIKKKGHPVFGDRKGGEATLRGRKEQAESGGRKGGGRVSRQDA